MDPPKFWTFRDLISEKGDSVILVTLLWTPRNENPNGASVLSLNFLMEPDLTYGGGPES